MKKIFYLLCVILAFMSCEKLDITPDNIQKSEDFTIKSSPARTYEIKQTGDSLYVFSTEAGLLYYHYKKDVLGQPIDISKINLNNEQAVKGIIHGKEKWNDIKKITIEGVTNAMDYACIKHNFQNVEYLDVSNTTIEAYTGPLGTLDYGNPLNYGADTFPYYAFCYGDCDCKWDEWDDPTDEKMWISMPNLKCVALPNTIKKIDFCAFKCAVSITEIIVPEGVVEIGAYNKYYKDNDPGIGKSFYNCISLERVYLPSTLELLGFGSFINNDSLKEVHIAAKEKPKETIDEWYSNNKNVDYYMTFGTALDWLNMEKLGYIGGIMVGGFSPLIYEPKTNATLYVPKGCKDNYKDWERHFQDIVEEE